MTSPLAVHDGWLLGAARLARAPLRRIALVAGALVAAFAAYCTGYTLIAGGVANPLLSLAWAAAAVLPWVAAWWLLPRAVSHAGVTGRRRLLAIVALVSLAALLAASLERIGARALGGDPGTTLVELLFRRLPALIAFGVAACLHVRWLARATPPALSPPLTSQAAITIATRSGSIELALADIDWVRAAGNYLELHTGGSYHLVRKTLQGFATAPGAELFVRAHRSLLVNRDRVAGLERRPRGRLALRLQGGETLPVGRQFRPEVERWVGRPRSP